MEKIVKLNYPIEYVEDNITKTISEIKLRRLKAKDLKAFPKDLGERGSNAKLNSSELLSVLSCMLAIPEKVLEELDLTDFTKIAEEVQSFL